MWRVDIASDTSGGSKALELNLTKYGTEEESQGPIQNTRPFAQHEADYILVSFISVSFRPTVSSSFYCPSQTAIFALHVSAMKFLSRKLVFFLRHISLGYSNLLYPALYEHTVFCH